MPDQTSVLTSTGEQPEVTFVIVAWRAREDALECLRSIREHAGLPHQIVVVDDGSGDGTPEAVRQAFPEAYVLAKDRNEGLVAGRNAALPLIRGRKVFMLDADTTLHSGAVPTLAGALDANPAIGLVGPKLVGSEGELQPSCRRYPPLLIPLMRRGPYAKINPNPRVHRRHMMQDFGHDTRRPVVWVSGAAQMWRADLPLRIGLYDRHVSSYGGEDLDWCLRVWSAGLEVHYVPDAVVTHHWQQVTKQNPFGSEAWLAFRDWYYLQAKHRGLRKDPRLARALA